MGYVHCMPAEVARLQHQLDNVVRGVLRTEAGDVAFRTRGHVVKATNRIYRGCPWKPSAGDRVLVDGDLGADEIVIDHIEADHLDRATEAASPHLDAIAAMIPRHPPASRDLRVWRGGAPARLRFCAKASRRGARGAIQDEIVHAAFGPDGWRLWSRQVDGGAIAATGMDGALLPIVARAAGADLLAGETERERQERMDANERIAAAAARIPEPPPFDDCPF